MFFGGLFGLRDAVQRIEDEGDQRVCDVRTVFLDLYDLLDERLGNDPIVAEARARLNDRYPPRVECPTG